MSLRAGSVALAITLAAVAAPIGLAQTQEQPRIENPRIENQQNPEGERLAREVIEGLLRESHVAEISSDLRQTLREVTLPIMRDAVQGILPGVPAPDAKKAAAMAKALTFLEYVRRASDELDVAVSKNREAMISEAAAVMAKTATASQIKDSKEVLNLPAVRKGFETFHVATKLVTAFTYPEMRSFYEFSAWAQSIQPTLQDGAGGAQGKPQPVPSPKKIAKAQAAINDFLRVSQLEEIVADAKRFAREVYVETAPMSTQERQELRDQIDQWEFAYNLQKAAALTVAPSVVAAALTDEQLEKLHSFILSPAIAKLFGIIRNVVKTGTAITKEDVLGSQKFLEEMERKATEGKSPTETDHDRDEWNALVDRWTAIITNSISPETLSGLKKSYEELQATGSPI